MGGKKAYLDKIDRSPVNRLLILVLALFLNAPLRGQDIHFDRRYVPGDTYRYRLTLSTYQNGKYQGSAVSVCSLRVVDSAGIPYDEVRWESLMIMGLKDTGNAFVAAAGTTPYRISLDPRGKIPIPPIQYPQMTEPITDFNTFFVAISPVLGTEGLRRIGDTTAFRRPVRGDFSNRQTILRGEDCLRVQVRLVDTAAGVAHLRTSFLPPSTPCFSYVQDTMRIPLVPDTMNNIQMVMPAGNDKFIVQYGREFFYIDSRVRMSDGKLVGATMHNELLLRLEMGCDANGEHCVQNFPLTIVRELKLELLP